MLKRCSACSKTAKVIRTPHAYHHTDKVGRWYICQKCGKTMNCYPTQKPSFGKTPETCEWCEVLNKDEGRNCLEHQSSTLIITGKESHE